MRQERRQSIGFERGRFRGRPLLVTAPHNRLQQWQHLFGDEPDEPVSLRLRGRLDQPVANDGQVAGDLREGGHQTRSGFGVGLHAEMAYYETPAGARVFSAGVLDFPAVLYTAPGVVMLDNLWRHMLEDLPGEEEPPEEPPDEPKPS